MEDRNKNRSWTIAATSAVAGMVALTIGLFLAVAKDSIAEDKLPKTSSKNVTVVTVPGDDEEGMAFAEAYGDDTDGGRGYLGLTLREDLKSDEGGAVFKYLADNGPAA